jgi:hypothetical protein
MSQREYFPIEIVAAPRASRDQEKRYGNRNGEGNSNRQDHQHSLVFEFDSKKTGKHGCPAGFPVRGSLL